MVVFASVLGGRLVPKGAPAGRGEDRMPKGPAPPPEANGRETVSERLMAATRGVAKAETPAGEATVGTGAATVVTRPPGGAHGKPSAGSTEEVVVKVSSSVFFSLLCYFLSVVVTVNCNFKKTVKR